MQSKIVHCKKSPYDVYIGRGSKWGNPFKIGIDGDRDTVIKKYEEYISKRTDLLDDIHELHNKVLGCYCYPEHCHGEVLIKLTEIKMSSQETILKWLEKKSNIPVGMYNEIKKEGVLSGSFVFGGFKEGSDIDVLIAPKYYDKYEELIQMGYAIYIPDEYDEDDKIFLSLYVKDPKERIINLILFYGQENFNCYEYATKAMKQMKNIEEYRHCIHDKNFRVAMFKLFREYGLPALTSKLIKEIKEIEEGSGTGDDIPF